MVAHGEVAEIGELITARKVVFSSRNFIYKSINSNEDAHNLARFKLGFGRHIWLGSPLNGVGISVIISIDQ